MSSVTETIDVDVDVRTVYNQWTQFETFPEFMAGVDEVRQLDDVTTHWVTSFGGVKREFDAEITEQRPDERVAWKSISGTTHAGVVTFHRLDDNRTRVATQLEIEPESAAEKLGDAVGMPAGRVKQDLKKFKEFIESRQNATGSWRGEVDPAAGVDRLPGDSPGGNIVG